MISPEIIPAEKPQFFAGRQVDFRFCDRDWLETNKTMIAWLEENRQKKGAAIVFIDIRDAPYTSVQDPDAGFHYALLGATPSCPPEPNEALEAYNVIPLPIFAHIMGWAEETQIQPWLCQSSEGGENDLSTSYQLTCTFQGVVNFLGEAFEGRVFFASREGWYSGEEQIFGAPQVCPATIELLKYLGKNPNEITDWGILEILAEIRNVPVESLGEKGYISDEELVGIMRRTVGIWKLGFRPPPATSEKLRNYWLK